MTMVLEPAGWDAGLTDVRVDVWVGAEHWEARPSRWLIRFAQHLAELEEGNHSHTYMLWVYFPP
jgi:hypothetical protein